MQFRETVRVKAGALAREEASRRMFIGTRLGSLVSVTLLCAAAVCAQSQPPATQPGGGVQQANKGTIHLDVVVSDKSGQAVVGLQQQDFTVLDNKAVQPIISFNGVTGRQAPIEVVLVVDAVNAPYQNVSYERTQIGKFLHDEEGNLAYPVALAVFTDRSTEVVGGFSSDGNELRTSLDRADIGLRDMGRSAGYYGAAERLQLSLAALRRVVTGVGTRPGRKILVWVSPGWPLLSGPNTELDSKQQQQIFANIVSLSTQLLQDRVTIDSINPVGPTGSVMSDWSYEEFLKGVSKPSQVSLGNLGLQVLAVQSGGIAYSFTNGIAERLHQCLASAAPYYEISFDPPPATKRDEYHRLEIKLAKPGLTARTRQGYYAQP